MNNQLTKASNQFDLCSNISEMGNVGDLTASSISADEGYYLNGDFNCFVQYPDREEVLRLLAMREEILKELAEYGSE